ncbi:MAG: SpoIIE family protein phosphatase [Bdellovibrionales bacterium]|nr:SpoIIE family protein phosphatase [Bdellovibrionales bacterium]
MEESELLHRIKQLEAELEQKESDLGLFREALKKANDKIESLILNFSQDLKVLKHLQKIMVPTELPAIEGVDISSKFIPSYISGGDYLDIFSHENKFRFGCIVSSASGYGISALLLTVLLKYTGRMEARSGSDALSMTTKIVKDLIKILKDEENNGEDSASLFYGLLDRRSFKLSYCLLGDVVGFVQTHSTGDIKPLITGGDSVNVNFSQVIASHEIELNSKDRLIVATPGLINIQSLNGERYGREGLLRSISKSSNKEVHDLRNQIVFDAQRFLAGQELQKDVTVLVMEVKDRVIKLA